MDLVRHIFDAQYASKLLVDHALSRFSTDNLSCMIVRFDSKAVHQTLSNVSASPIGVEGDPPSTKRGGISEAEHLVGEARKSMGDSFIGGRETEGDLEVGQDVIKEEEEKETGPEVDAEGLKNVTMKDG